MLSVQYWEEITSETYPVEHSHSAVPAHNIYHPARSYQLVPTKPLCNCCFRPSISTLHISPIPTSWISACFHVISARLECASAQHVHTVQLEVFSMVGVGHGRVEDFAVTPKDVP